MFTLKVKNKYGEELELTHNAAYVVTGIDGITSPEATINTTRNATSDGGVYNSAYVEVRQLIITIAINHPAEENRMRLYKYFKAKQPVRVSYKTRTRDVYIDGYVKSINANPFENLVIAQAVIECPQPYLVGVDKSTTTFSHVTPTFTFPFAIEETGIPFSVLTFETNGVIVNAGDAETGAVINLHCVGAVNNPVVLDIDTGEFFGLNYGFSTGDTITINTRTGQKSVMLSRGGTVTNLIGYLKPGSTWFVMRPGDNSFNLTAETGGDKIQAMFEIENLYEGA